MGREEEKIHRRNERDRDAASVPHREQTQSSAEDKMSQVETSRLLSVDKEEEEEEEVEMHVGGESRFAERSSLVGNYQSLRNVAAALTRQAAAWLQQPCREPACITPSTDLCAVPRCTRTYTQRL